jgi:hypothetical protein
MRAPPGGREWKSKKFCWILKFKETNAHAFLPWSKHLMGAQTFDASTCWMITPNKRIIYMYLLLICMQQLLVVISN